MHTGGITGDCLSLNRYYVVDLGYQNICFGLCWTETVTASHDHMRHAKCPRAHIIVKPATERKNCVGVRTHV